MARSKRPHHRPPLIFTREIFDIIPVWVEMGARPEEIAAAIGSTVGSLRVKCSNAGVSLSFIPPSISGGLHPSHWATIRRAAGRRGKSVPTLIAEIVVGVAEHNLFAAVLGDYDDVESVGDAPPLCAAR